MTTKDFTLSLLTDQSPEKVFQSVNNVRKWWSGYYSEEVIGGTEKLNDEFSFSAGEGVHFTRHKLVEVIPNRKVVWLTTESKLNFIQKQDEWTGSKVIFEISQIGNKTELVFTHEGLNPEAECYEACAPAWTQYLQGKLLPLINSDNY
jgi:hypothetical protein